MTDNNFGDERGNFRDELGQLPPDLTLGATSEQIMRRGRRIRTVRQGSIAGLAALAVVGSATAVALGVHHGSQTVQAASGGGFGGPVAAPASVSPVPASSSPLSPAPAPVSAPASWAAPAAGASALVSSASAPSSSSATIAPAVSCIPAAQSELGAPAATSDGNPPAWGTTIPAGTPSDSSVVLYGVHVSDAALPCTHFALMLGTTDGTGVTGVYAANEFDGSDSQPGFHAVSSVSGLNQLTGWYFIGYYVGPAATISVKETQRAAPVAATVVPWSANPNIKIWWLSGTGSAPTFGPVKAMDAAGKALPTGTHAQPGVG